MNITREAEEDRVITNFVATKDIIRIEGREEPLYPLSFNELREFMRSISTPIDWDGLGYKIEDFVRKYYTEWASNPSAYDYVMFFKKELNIVKVTDSNQQELLTDINFYCVNILKYLSDEQRKTLYDWLIASTITYAELDKVMQPQPVKGLMRKNKTTCGHNCDNPDHQIKRR